MQGSSGMCRRGGARGGLRAPGCRRGVVAAGLICGWHVAALGGTYATSVVSYDAGTGASAGFTDSATALGSPTRISGFDLRVTPFNPPFQSSEVVSIGRGGHLTLAFDTPAVDDASNPYGIDLLVFGNSFFYSDDFSPIAQSIWKPGGVVEVSADGIDWRMVQGAVADGVFPTLGYRDGVDPFGSDGGSVETNFLLPVDPAFSPWGKDFDGLKAGYGASGGGAGIDLGSVGLHEARYVRISNPLSAAYSIEIDAISDVIPSPGGLGTLAASWLGVMRRRRR